MKPRSWLTTRRKDAARCCSPYACCVQREGVPDPTTKVLGSSHWENARCPGPRRLGAYTTAIRWKRRFGPGGHTRLSKAIRLSSWVRQETLPKNCKAYALGTSGSILTDVVKARATFKFDATARRNGRVPEVVSAGTTLTIGQLLDYACKANIISLLAR